MNTLLYLNLLVLQIPQNIDVGSESDRSPLSAAPTWMLGLILLLLVAVVYYIFVYRKRR